MKFIVVEDGLAGNGPHLERLLELGYPFIIVVKPDNHQPCLNRFKNNCAREKPKSSRRRTKRGRSAGIASSTAYP